jgi:predicted nucleic acid-binding protein
VWCWGWCGSVRSPGNLTPDAQLAALAISSNSLLCSADNDFRRFPGLRFLNPLA